MDLRPYQDDTLSQLFDYACAHPEGSVLIVLPPRSGKNPTFATAAKLMVVDQDLRGLWVAPRVEILDATVEHMVACGIAREDIGVIYRDRATTPDARLQVATEATLDRRRKPKADVVFWDEAHHDAATRRRRIRKLYPESLHVGFTGTPERLTGGGLDKDYDTMLVPVQPSELIHDGYLSVATVYAPEEKRLPNVKRLRLRGGDFAPEQLEELVGHDAAVDMLIDEWKRLGEGLPTIVFPVTIRHSKRIAERFRAAGVLAEHLDGDTSPAARADMIARLRAGALAILSSPGVLAEGHDFPEVKCVVLARPTRSNALHRQQGARCMTPHKGIRPRILDVAGNSFRHGYPWDDREWQLSRRRGKARVGAAAPVKRCPCGALSPALAAACIACHKVFEVTIVPAAPVALKEVRFTAEQIAKKRAQLADFAKKKGFAPEWAEKVLRAMTGERAA